MLSVVEKLPLNELEKAGSLVFESAIIILIFILSFKIAKCFLQKIDKKRFKFKIDEISKQIQNEYLPKLSWEENLFKEYTEKVIREIKSLLNNKDDFNHLNIAINGKFGSGKSTIINLLLNKLKPEEFDVLKLNVLSLYKTEQVIENLIRELCIKFNYKFYENLIKIYSSATLNSGFLNIEFLIDDKVPYENRIAHFKNHVYRTLKKQEKKLLLVLDEFDRIIDKEVLLNALKFIHIFSRIPNVYLIATVDYENFQEIFGKEYYIVNLLEKVFDYRIDIEIPKYSLKEVFIKEIKNFLNEHKDIFKLEEERELILDKIKEFVASTDLFTFETIRELKKLLESIKGIINGELKYLMEEIWFIDLIIIEWIKIRHPFVWNIIKNNYRLLVKKEDLWQSYYDEEIWGHRDDLKKMFELKDYEKDLNNIFNKIKELVKNDYEYEIIASCLIYLMNFHNLPTPQIKEITGLEKIFLSEIEVLPHNFQKKDEDREEKLKYWLNLIENKRLLRLKNIKKFLGITDKNNQTITLNQ